MKPGKFTSLLVAGTIGLTACMDQPEPTGMLRAHGSSVSFSAAGAAAGVDYILIARNGKLPSNLDQLVAARGGTVESTIPQIGIARVNSSSPAFAAEMGGVAGIQSVVPDIIYSAEFPGRTVELSEQEIASFQNPPNSGDVFNYLHDLQWGHVAVRAIDAWNAGHEGQGVRVAVIDNGVNRTHPDIAPNLNQALSRSFVSGELYYSPAGSHGTHVAGTIAASRDNGLVIGIAPKAEIVVLKSLSAITGSGSSYNTMAALVYAGDISADVINMSLGSYLPTRGSYTYEDANGNTIRVTGADIQQFLHAYQRAVDYAYGKGATIVAAAGNSAINLHKDASAMALPAELRNVISVSALGPLGWAEAFDTNLDVLASYSNFGRTGITFGAPGGNYDLPHNNPCTMPATGTRACWIHDGVLSSTSTGWGWSWGTSMASPHVAGVAALIVGKNGGSMSPQAVLQALRRGADDLGKPGVDDEYGYGRVNAIRSLN